VQCTILSARQLLRQQTRPGRVQFLTSRNLSIPSLVVRWFFLFFFFFSFYPSARSLRVIEIQQIWKLTYSLNENRFLFSDSLSSRSQICSCRASFTFFKRLGNREMFELLQLLSRRVQCRLFRPVLDEAIVRPRLFHSSLYSTCSK
jgi:hypothetical protein